MRKATDIIRDRLRSCVVVVGTRDETKGLIVAAVTKDLVNAFNAGQIIKSIAAKYHGKGGGNPQMAQGGVPAERGCRGIELRERAAGCLMSLSRRQDAWRGGVS